MFLHSCKLTPFTAGASSIYDGTPLVEQSVARVRIPPHTHKFSTLSDVSPNDREPPSSTCPSITALDLSASLKDPKLWDVLSSTSACATNGPRSSGCKLTSHRLVETPARYVSGFLSLQVSQTMTGHCLWRERGGIVDVLSLPQREFFNCCPSCCTRSPLAYVRGASSHIPQIFQSGTASTLPNFDPYRGVPSWMLFAKATKSCATASPDNTFACLMSVGSSDILTAMTAGLAIELFPFRPVLDGPEGIMSDYPAKRLSRGAGGRVPFIAGTVLDEGLFLLR